MPPISTSNTTTARIWDPLSLALGLGFAFMWSSAFTSARIIVETAPPLTTLSLRFLVSGLLALGIGWTMGQRLRLDRAGWRATVIFGLCQNTLYLGLYFLAMQTVPASLAAIMASTMPLLVAIIGFAVFGQRVSPLGWAGLAAGIAGVALIMGTRVQGGADLFGLALCGIGVTALAVATLVVRGASAGGNLLMVVGAQMLVGAVSLGAISALLEPWAIPWESRLTLAFLYTTLIPGLAATLVWFLLVGRIGAVRAATYHFLNPVFGVAIAWALLGEPVGWSDAIGVAIATIGIFLVQTSRAG
ncbi:MAG: DMT family transporter [Mangrovicoccus sp.]